MALIAVADKNQLKPVYALMLQKGNDLPGSGLEPGGASAVAQIMLSVLRADVDAVSLPHIHLGHCHMLRPLGCKEQAYAA